MATVQKLLKLKTIDMGQQRSCMSRVSSLNMAIVASADRLSVRLLDKAIDHRPTRIWLCPAVLREKG